MRGRLLGIIVLLVVGYGFFVPQAIPYPKIREKVLGIRSEANVPENDQLLEAAKGAWQKITEKFLIFAKNTKLPKRVTGLPEEVVVEDAVKQLTERVKKLPAEQAKKAKQNFCADIVAESTKAGQVAGATDNND